MCHFTCQAQKITIYRDFNLICNSWWKPRWCPLLVTSQASSSATAHKTYLILLSRSKAFHWRQNRFEILQISKTLGAPSTPLVRCGINLRVCPRIEEGNGLAITEWFIFGKKNLQLTTFIIIDSYNCRLFTTSSGWFYRNLIRSFN